VELIESCTVGCGNQVEFEGAVVQMQVSSLQLLYRWRSRAGGDVVHVQVP
jgi:hypothetical protein